MGAYIIFMNKITFSNLNLPKLMSWKKSILFLKPFFTLFAPTIDLAIGRTGGTGGEGHITF